jgi:serine phosphatase RsbU (regulator of sigma subunit)
MSQGTHETKSGTMPRAETWLDRVGMRIRPSIRAKSGAQKVGLLLDMNGLIMSAAFVPLGIIWLISRTEWTTLIANWSGLLFFVLVLFVLDRYDFELRMRMSRTAYASASGSLEPLVLWTAVLIYGPAGIWAGLVHLLQSQFRQIWRESSNDLRWTYLRNFAQELNLLLLAGLTGLTIFYQMGGTTPLAGFNYTALWPAIGGTLAYLSMIALLILPFTLFLVRDTRLLTDQTETTPANVIRFVYSSMSSSYLTLPFGILAAGLYTAAGIWMLLFFLLGIFLVTLLAHNLSQNIRENEQRTREMTTLQQLSRTILEAPLNDHAGLPALLQSHLEGMFLRTLMHVWLFPDQILFETQLDAPFPSLDQAYKLVKSEEATFYNLAGVRLANETSGRITRRGIVVPISDDENIPQGGILILRREDYGDVIELLPAAQALADQISAALLSIEQYAQAVENEKMTRELEIAGRIQATFLPDQVPILPGWEISALLDPARQASGDFYDFIPLDDGRLGLLVADVADKGTGAALYMALSRTLLRTYAKQHPEHPEKALELANERILEDTKSDQFVTVFYGVLDPRDGRFTYANAGHNPPFLLNEAVTSLTRTGIPLGMFAGSRWEQETVPIAPGDLLVLYSDGIPEAQDEAQTEYGEARLLQLFKDSRAIPLLDLEKQIITDVHQFMAPAPQFDDITLLMVRRCLSAE